MQKFCIWETEYKIPKIDCIKLESQAKLMGHFCDFSSKTRFLKFNIHKRPGLSPRFQIAGQIQQVRVWFNFSSILLWKYPGEIPGPGLLMTALFYYCSSQKLFIVWQAQKEGLIILSLTAQLKNHSCTFKITTEPSHGM